MSALCSEYLSNSLERISPLFESTRNYRNSNQTPSDTQNILNLAIDFDNMASELSKYIEDELKSRGMDIEESGENSKKERGPMRMKSPHAAWTKGNEIGEDERTPLIPGTLIPAPTSSIGAKDKKTRKGDRDHQTLMGALRVEARVKVRSLHALRGCLAA